MKNLFLTALSALCLMCSCSNEDNVSSNNISSCSSLLSISNSRGETHRYEATMEIKKSITDYVEDLRNKKFQKLDDLVDYLETQEELIYEDAANNGIPMSQPSAEAEKFIQSLDYIDYKDCESIDDIQQLMFSALMESEIQKNSQEFVAIVVAIDAFDDALTLFDEVNLNQTVSRGQSQNQHQGQTQSFVNVVVDAAKKTLKCYLGTQCSSLLGAITGIPGSGIGMIVGSLAGYGIGVATFCL